VSSDDHYSDVSLIFAGFQCDACPEYRSYDVVAKGPDKDDAAGAAARKDGWWVDYVERPGTLGEYSILCPACRKAKKL
jgi:hypothetical protein